MANPELEKVLEAAWNKGFAFGKYTQDIQLTADVIALLENSDHLMREYMLEFRRAVTSGMLETLRG
ncbi:hypothetical protein [Acinetobacter haemolyticus]|uniref:hypothetical protein n=1 Tax=Acinetobacter haemolyticus TaxID=29430 RepID=UPI000E165834|nr:hypothetical protein [Acinetobacter haemolyticus]WPO66388.1 hypothetical protein SDC64_10635 [Acinetobacter haemolyticus]SUU22789.1 Uncharacterised protein [Acinetobacter haemolyticus]